MKTKIFNLIILDESGSMESIKQQAITGVNETIQTIRNAQKQHEEQEHYVSHVSFNSSSVKNIYDCKQANQVEELTDKLYIPDCCTPLYDAMGLSLNKLRKSITEEDKVLVTIITDGYENASQEYSGEAIKALVDSLRSKGWVFTYIGANQDVEKVAATISVTNVMSFQTSVEGTKEMFEKEKKSRKRWFEKVANGCTNLAENFFDDEENK